MKVVLDTNVLISGIFFSGSPARILKAWRDEIIQFVISPEIVDEYIRVADTLKGQFPALDIGPILNLVIRHSDLVQPPPLTHQVCDDAQDDKFLACALAGGCKLIISGDKHLLKVSGYQDIDVLTPREFIELYLKK